MNKSSTCFSCFCHFAVVADFAVVAGALASGYQPVIVVFEVVVPVFPFPAQVLSCIT